MVVDTQAAQIKKPPLAVFDENYNIQAAQIKRSPLVVFKKMSITYKLLK